MSTTPKRLSLPDGTEAASGARGAAPVAGRGTLFLFLARLAFMGGGLVISVLLARYLGPRAFGIYGLVMSLLTWAEFVIGSGGPGSIARLAPRFDRDPAFARIAQGLVLAAGFAVAGIGWLAAPVLARLFGLDDGWLFTIAFADVPLMAMVFGYHGLLYARGRLELLAAALALQVAVKTAAIGIAALAGFGIAAMIGAHLLGTAAALLLLLARLPTPPGRPRPPLAGALIAAALPITAYALLYQAQANLGLWFLGALGEVAREATGHFAAALNVARVLTLVPSVLVGVLFAKVAEEAARGRHPQAAQEVGASLRFALLLLMPAVVALAMEAEGIVDLLYGEAYATTAATLRWLALAIALMGLLDILLHVLLAAGDNRQALLILASTLAIFACASAFLTFASAEGVAIAMGGSALLGLGFAFFVVRRFLRHPLEDVRAGRILLSCLLMAGVLWLWESSGPELLLEFAAAGSLYLLLLPAVGVVSLDEVRRLIAGEAG